MGIRDTSYHEIKTLYTYAKNRSGIASSNNPSDSLAIDSSGSLYVMGTTTDTSNVPYVFLVKSLNQGTTWTTLTLPNSQSVGGLSTLSLAIDQSDNIFCTLASSSIFLFKSSNYGNTWTTLDTVPLASAAYGISFSASSVYYSFASASQAFLKFSSNGASGTFTVIDSTGSLPTATNYGSKNTVSYSQDFQKVFWGAGKSVRSGTISGTFAPVEIYNNTDTGMDVVSYIRSFNSRIYILATSGSVGNESFVLRVSSTGRTGSFSTITTDDVTNRNPGRAIVFFSSSDLAYSLDSGAGTNGGRGLLYSSLNQSSSWFIVSPVECPDGQYDIAGDDKRGMVYVLLGSGSANSIYRIVNSYRLTANSASLSPVFFGTSFGYYLTATLPNKFDLANVSEFPHSSGLFQMKNMILGTTDSGKIGNKDDSIIKISHIGSTVKIMWPRQDNAESNLRGYGDLSAGQSVGKLSTTFEPGDFIDVTEFDHMALYCYLRKQTSGTLDDIIIQIERKPLTNIGFTTEQAVSYATSGSIAEARLRDLQYPKEIDYGDLSVREIGYPIDIPLTNVKQVRISAKHRNGQIDDLNKNFIVYGRFIKADKNQTET